MIVVLLCLISYHKLSVFIGATPESIDEIIKNDPNSIIIVQGDHSPMEWQSKDNFKNPEKMFPILSAVYVPGLDQKGGMAKYLSNSPTPVNDFRIIFSYLSKTPVEILQGRSYNQQLKEVMTLLKKLWYIILRTIAYIPFYHQRRNEGISYNV